MFAAMFAGLTAMNPGELVVGLAFGVGTGTVALVGAVLADRAPDNRIGAWLLAASILITISVAGLNSYAKTGQAAYPPWPGAAAIAVVGNIPVVIAVVIILIWIPAIFPTGRLLSGRWQILVWVMVVALLATSAPMVITASQMSDAGALAIADALSDASTLAFGICFIGGLTSVVIRFRHGSPVEREQTKWFLAATVFAVTVAPLAFLAPAVWGKDTPFGVILLMLALVAQPVAIGIAVLRYRLYAIDRIVSRTIAYVLITGVLAVVYAGVVIAVRAAVGGLIGDGSAEVVVSTLVVAALFQPVRRRVQSSVSHRFDRRRYDADRLVTRFGEHVRNEVLVDAVLGGLDDTVRIALAPSASGVWLRAEGRATAIL